MADHVLHDPSFPNASLTRLRATDDDPVAVWEEALERGWSDGLPVIAPTAQRVEAMLGGRDPQAAAPLLGQDEAAMPLAKVAANAVMAGCAPQYFPALLAALGAMAACGMTSAFSNAPCAPLLVFNGPIRHQLDINCSHEMLSMTTRSNATIGRAVRLVFMNLLGAKSPRLFDVQHGMPGRTSMVFGEFEEESPWDPHSVSEGLPRGQSAVTIFAATGTMPDQLPPSTATLERAAPHSEAMPGLHARQPDRTLGRCRPTDRRAIAQACSGVLDRWVEQVTARE